MQNNDGLVSPEAVRLDLPLATVGSRGVAIMLDWLILGILIYGTLFTAEAALSRLDSAPVIVALIVVLLVTFGYPIVFEAAWMRGRTPGKAAMGLRVVTVEGAPVRFRHAAIRSALGLVDFAMTAGIAGVVSSVVSSRNQRLGDIVAGTVVLRERTGAGDVQVRDFAMPAEVRHLSETIDTSGLTQRDYAAVRSYLLRVNQLSDRHGDEIARRLLLAIAPRIAGVPSGMRPHLVLEAVAAHYQQRYRTRSG